MSTDIADNYQVASLVRPKRLQRVGIWLIVAAVIIKLAAWFAPAFEDRRPQERATRAKVAKVFQVAFIGAFASGVLFAAIGAASLKRNALVESDATDLREKQRSCARWHSVKALALLFIIFAIVFGRMFIGRHLAIPAGAFAWLISGVAFVGAFLIFGTDRIYARKIGFVCPQCGRSLYYASDMYGSRSSLIRRGTCPRCGADVVALFTKQHQKSEEPNQSSDPVHSSGTSRAGHEPRHR
jgi:hypothetical protein